MYHRRGGKLIKVRVYYKNPLDQKSSVMLMTEETIKRYRGELKSFSPYKKIVKI
jgi:hypothetical protein